MEEGRSLSRAMASLSSRLENSLENSVWSARRSSNRLHVQVPCSRSTSSKPLHKQPSAECIKDQG